MKDQPPLEELLYEEEGTTLDFKREQYVFVSGNDYQKSELLKDILAFANAWRRSDAYILIGVEEVKGGRSTPLGIEIELDDAQLQQFVNSKTQKPIDFNYRTLLVDGLKIGVIRIPLQSRPYYLEKDYGKLKRHVVYICRGSSTGEASPEEIHNMGKAEVQNTQESPKIEFAFANLKERTSLGASMPIEAIVLDIPPLKNIPDYREEETYGPFGMRLSSLSLNHARADYFRDLVKYYYVLRKSEKLSFCLVNSSTFTVSDIRVEIIIDKQESAFTFFEEDDFPEFPRSHFDVLANMRPISEQLARNSKHSIEIQDLGDRFRIEVPFEKAQPKQTVFSDEWIFLASNESFEFTANVTIYADNIPLPLETSLTVQSVVTHEPVSLEAIESMHKEFLLTKYSS